MPKTTLDMKHERTILAWLENWFDANTVYDEEPAVMAKALLIDLEIDGYGIVKDLSMSTDKST